MGSGERHSDHKGLCIPNADIYDLAHLLSSYCFVKEQQLLSYGHGYVQHQKCAVHTYVDSARNFVERVSLEVVSIHTNHCFEPPSRTASHVSSIDRNSGHRFRVRAGSASTFFDSLDAAGILADRNIVRAATIPIGLIAVKSARLLIVLHGLSSPQATLRSTSDTNARRVPCASPKALFVAQGL